MKRVALLVLSIVCLFALPGQVAAKERAAYSINGQEYLFVLTLQENKDYYLDDKVSIKFQSFKVDPAQRPAYETREGVDNLDTTMTLQLEHGGAKADRALWKHIPGTYFTAYAPTAEGQYKFNFIGEINGIQLSIPFTCGAPGKVEENQTGDVIKTLADGNISCPGSKANIGFPHPVKSSHELSQAAPPPVEAAASNADSAAAAQHRMIIMVIAILGVFLSSVALILFWREIHV